MNNQIATTPEQSQRLIACGVNTNTADMCYIYFNQDGRQISRKEYLKLYCETLTDCRKDLVPKDFVDCNYQDNDSPAWSLSALLTLLPTEIKEDNGYFDEISTYGLLIYPYMQGWQIDYQYCENDECHCLKCIHDTELIEACVKAIEWLTKNGYKLNDN